MLLERLKWPCEPHYLHAVRWVGEDEYGDWLAFDAGTPIWRGRELLGHGLSSGLVLFPRHQAWAARFPEGREYLVAVDVSTSTVWSDHGVSTVDLDLCVRRRADGVVEEAGRDAFELAGRAKGYPRDLIELANGESDRMRAALAEFSEPFRSAWLSWKRKGTDLQLGWIAPARESEM